MKSTCDYLDAVQAKLNLPSDYALAKALNITRQAVSNYRSGRGSLDDAVAVRVAELLEIHPGFVLLDMYAERTKDAGTRRIWEDVAEGFHAPSHKARSGRRHSLTR